MASSTGCSLFTMVSFCVAYVLSPTKIVGIKISGCMKEVFKPFLMIKTAGSLFSMDWKRMGSYKCKSAFVGSLTLRPLSNNTIVLPPLFEELRFIISVLCRNATNETLRLGLHSWTARFTVWTALSPNPINLGWYTPDTSFQFTVFDTTD